MTGLRKLNPVSVPYQHPIPIKQIDSSPNMGTLRPREALVWAYMTSFGPLPLPLGLRFFNYKGSSAPGTAPASSACTLYSP